MSSRTIAVACALLALAAPASGHSPAADGCGGTEAAEYSRELQVMRATAVTLAAPLSASDSPPRLELERRYAISLLEQTQVSFRAGPARAARGANSRGGVFNFVTGLPGKYRITLTSRHWVDVIDGTVAVESVGHFGPGCALAHKIVEFELPGGREMTLQVSGREDAIVGIAITHVADSAASVARVVRRAPLRRYRAENSSSVSVASEFSPNVTRAGTSLFTCSLRCSGAPRHSS